MSDQKDRSAVWFDSTLSLAFIDAALRQGHVTHYNEDRLPNSLVLDRTATARHKRTALELAVLFDDVRLLGAGPGKYDFTRLLDHGVIKGYMDGFSFQYKETHLQALFMRSIKTSVLRTALRRTNRYCKFIGFPQVQAEHGSRIFDQLANAFSDGIEIYSILPYVKWEMGKRAGKLDISEQSAAFAKRFLFIHGAGDGRKMASIATLSSNILGEVNSFWWGYAFSATDNGAFASYRFPLELFQSKTQVHDMHDTYIVCKAILREELGYAPVVETFDDVLRLRDNKYIARFRTQLQRWCYALQSGDCGRMEEIKRDLALANRDLKHLQRCKAVESWAFWIETALSMVPVLGLVAAGSSACRQLWKNRLEKRSSWLMITRSA